MQKRLRLTVVMVTHSIEEAVYLADSVYVMNGVNPGSIEKQITISRGENLSHADFREEPRFREYCGILRRALVPVEKNGEAP